MQNPDIEQPSRRTRLKRGRSSLRQLRERNQRKGLSSAIERRRENASVALSYPQQRLWFIAQRYPDLSAYNIATALSMKGALETATLCGVFSEIVRRHESLRTTFSEKDERLLQTVGAPRRCDLPEVDLSRLLAVEEELYRLAREEARRIFDLERDLLLRTILLHTGSDENCLLITMHHIASDGWSLGVLIREVVELYRASVENRPPRLPGLPVQYPDFALWQRSWLEGERLESHLRYWRRQLEGSPTVLELPADRPRPPILAFRGTRQRFRLASPLREKLEKFAQLHTSTLFMLITATYQLLLHRWSGQNDVVLGTPIANRMRAELENLIGFFVNILPLRTRFEAHRSFRAFLEQVRQVSLEANEHQELPFDKLVEELRPERTESHVPLTQVTLAFQNMSLPAIDLPGLVTEVLDVDPGNSMFDLTLVLRPLDRGIEGWFEYSTDLFDATTIRRLVHRLAQLLESVVEAPDRPVSELALLSRGEVQQLLREWNDTASDLPGEASLVQLFKDQVGRTPHAVALVCGEEVVSYAALDRLADVLALDLHERGIGPGRVVGVLVDRGIDLMVTLWGVLKTGGAYVPLDADYPPQRLARMVRGTDLLVTQEHRSAKVVDVVSPISEGEGPKWVVLGDRRRQSVPVAEAEARLLASEPWKILPEHLIYVLYTSGSTGLPKGSGVYQRGFVNLIRWFLKDFHIGPQDRSLLISSFSFDLTQKNLYAVLLVGGQLHFPPPGPYDPRELSGTIERHRITLVNATPSAFYPIVESSEPDWQKLAPLREVFLGGEPIAADRLAPWLTSPGCQAELVNTYGPTECTDISAFFRLDSALLRAESPIPVGRSITNAAVLVLDPSLELCPIGAPGELCITGSGVGMGYVGAPAQTAERFVPDPRPRGFGERIYRTGDLVRTWHGGEVFFLGRVDHQVKVRGFRIEPEEVEAVLHRHPGMEGATVVPRPDEFGESQLVAYVVPGRERAQAVRNWLRLERDGRLDEAERYELPNGQLIFHLNRAETDFVYRELFEEESYFRHGIELHADACVFDVGANIGLFDIFVGQRWPGVRMYAFEPLPPIYRILRLNLEIHGIEVELFEHGVASTAGHATFEFFPNASILSGRFYDAETERETVRSFLLSQLAEGERRPTEPELDELLEERLRRQSFDCSMRTLSEMISETGVDRIDLLKVDVEKAELDVLRGVDPSDWPKIRQVVAEVHDLDGQLGRITELLEQQGFAVVSEQDRTLVETDIYNLYARRPGERRPPPEADPKSSTKRVWGSWDRLLRDLRRDLAQELPEYMMPAVFVPLEKLPLTPNGKVDRRNLPRTGGSQLEKKQVFALPRTPQEELLATLWSRVLGRSQIGIHESFFDLGGHSLLATQVISRVRNLFQVDVSLTRFFEAPTIAGFSERIEAARASSRKPPPPMEPRPRDQPLPLSFSQMRLWFLDQLEPASSVYNIPAAVILRGDLRVAALQAGFAELVERHEPLRTRFPNREGTPFQEILPHFEVSIPRIDLGRLERDLQERELERLRAAESQQVFDLRKGPLWNVQLVRLGSKEHGLLLTLHHIIADGWSMDVLIRELGAFYADFCHGRRPAIPPLEIQYADFSVWQHAWLAGAELERQVGYWRDRLAEAPGLLEMPTDRPRPRVLSSRGGSVTKSLPPSLADRVTALARNNEATLFMTLLAVFDGLLSRWAGVHDLLVGTVIAGRNRSEVEGLIGFFVNTLVLRADLAADPSFEEVIRRVRAITIDAYDHQDLPFEKLVLELNPERNRSHAPLCQVLFTVDAEASGTSSLRDLELLLLPVEAQNVKFDLTLRLREDLRGMTLIYSTDLFDKSTMKRLLLHYQAVLEEALADSQKRLSAVSFLSAAERAQLIAEWNDSALRESWDRCLHELFESWAERLPERTAVVFNGPPEESLSYGELNRRSNRLAHALKARGAGPETPIGLFGYRSLEMVVGLWGILKAGGFYAPITGDTPAQRVVDMARRSGMEILLTSSRLAALLAEAGVDRHIELICLDSDPNQGSENPQSGARLSNPACVIHTSGSTGEPKGVVVEHRHVLHFFGNLERQAKLEQGWGYALVQPFSVDSSLTTLFPPFLTGGTLHVISEEAALTPNLLGEHMRHHEVEFLKLAPSHLKALEDAGTDLSVYPSRCLIFGGEASYQSWAHELKERVGDLPLFSNYGPSETTVGSSMYRVPRRRKHACAAVPLGYPFDNIQYHVLDRCLGPQSLGTGGELYIEGAGVTRGYLNRPGLTAERYLPDPFTAVPGGRMYRTGDVVRRLADGDLEFLGRNDHQVKIRGFRIELGEIEAALKQHPSLENAAVGVIDAPKGGKSLVAYVVWAKGEEKKDPALLQRELAKSLPSYMVPAAFAVLEELPRLAHGKLNRKALATLGSPDRVQTDPFVAPRDDLEWQLSAIWEEVFEKRPIGLRDDFFELGGHSLLAVRLIARIRQRFGGRLALHQLFECPTIELLAAVLRRGHTSPKREVLVPIRPEGEKSPFFCVHPVGGNVFCYLHLAHQLASDQPFYGLQSPSTEIADLAEMARYYVAEIRRVQATGPYFLGGWSFGGVVAFEMARRLLEQDGEKIGLLVLIDSAVPRKAETTATDGARSVNEVDVLRAFGSDLLKLTSSMNGEELDTQLDRLRDAFLEQGSIPSVPEIHSLFERVQETGLLPAELTTEQVLELYFRFRRNFIALRNYEPRPFRGPLAVIQAETLATKPPVGYSRDWSVLTSQTPIEMTVPGNHYTILKMPHHEILARHLGTLLEEAREVTQRDLNEQQ